MISKWFIGVNAKSKGFFKGWGYGSYCSTTSSYNNTVACPSFTKQSALAKSFNSEQEALDELEKFRKESQAVLNKEVDRLKKLKSAKASWTTKTVDEKVTFLTAYDICPEYTVTRKHRAFGNRAYKSSLYFGYGSKINIQKLTSDELTALDNVDWNKENSKSKEEVDKHKNRLVYIREKLVVREQDLEIKFMDKERRSIKWEVRGDNATSGSYCNVCGGAVPGIPQLRIGAGSYRHSDGVTICAICMKVLAQEAKIQAGKISDEIMEHYQCDRFIRSV